MCKGCQRFDGPDMIDLADILTALGLVLVLEGVMYTLFPTKAQEMMQIATRLPHRTLRNIGVGALLVGFAVIWFIRT
jgi:uncharacterized protein